MLTIYCAQSHVCTSTTPGQRACGPRTEVRLPQFPSPSSCARRRGRILFCRYSSSVSFSLKTPTLEIFLLGDSCASVTVDYPRATRPNRENSDAKRVCNIWALSHLLLESLGLAWHLGFRGVSLNSTPKSSDRCLCLVIPGQLLICGTQAYRFPEEKESDSPRAKQNRQRPSKLLLPTACG